MDHAFDHDDPTSLDAEFERDAMEEDGSAAEEILASGMPIHISRDDTPAGHVVRVYPNGREELVRIDWDEMRRLLG